MACLNCSEVKKVWPESTGNGSQEPLGSSDKKAQVELASVMQTVRYAL